MDDWNRLRMRNPTLYAALHTALNPLGPKPAIEPHWKAIKHNGLRPLVPPLPPPPPQDFGFISIEPNVDDHPRTDLADVLTYGGIGFCLGMGGIQVIHAIAWLLS